jgi:hypothetical protein
MANETDKPVIALESGFTFGAVDGLRGVTPGRPLPPPPPPPSTTLGPLAPMVGTWSGSGFNTIFRPLNPASPNQLPTPVGGDNILELNLTSETTTFTAINGLIPNRGMTQADISLSGLVYLQQISDVTTQPATGIHIEPGIWIVIPPTTSPNEGQTVARMASIPHGTTVNSQGTATVINGPPTIPAVDITPNFIGGGRNPFPSQTATNGGTARIPQDLTSFIAEGKITQAMLDDPNSVLRAAIVGQNIVSTTQLSISTSVVAPIVAGGGTANVAFLLNTGADTIGSPNGPNAQSFQMNATFWIETVEHVVTIPPIHPGGPPVTVPLPGLPGQVRKVTLDTGTDPLPTSRTVTLRFTQIQYSQTVILNFNGLSWPHVSVATLVSSSPLTLPPGWRG